MDFWPTLVAAVVCLVITQGLQIFAPNVQGSIFDGILAYLQKPEDGRSKFEFAMLTYVIINVLQGCFSGLKALAQELVQRRMACSVRLKLFASVVRMDIAFFDTMHTGQLTSRLTNDASSSGTIAPGPCFGFGTGHFFKPVFLFGRGRLFGSSSRSETTLRSDDAAT